MKTTVEISDELLQKIKMIAVLQKKSLKEIFTHALEAEVRQVENNSRFKPWLRHFGSAVEYKSELDNIAVRINEDIDVINMEDWK